MRQISEWLETGAVKPPPIQEFPFSKFHNAFEAISSRRAMGKVVVVMES
jgi:NADPH:quinone reductase-like Zn-dependent oxidoreductase